MATIFPVSHMLLIFHSPKGLLKKSTKYEKLRKYWSCFTRNHVIINARDYDKA